MFLKRLAAPCMRIMQWSTPNRGKAGAENDSGIQRTPVIDNALARRQSMHSFTGCNMSLSPMSAGTLAVRCRLDRHAFFPFVEALTGLASQVILVHLTAQFLTSCPSIWQALSICSFEV